MTNETDTPTDDDREVLAKVIDDAADAAVSPERMRSSLTIWLADAILAAGFRRSEVPEPSAECEYVDLEVGATCQNFYDTPCETGECGESYCWTCNACGACKANAAEPQGEPSEAALDAAMQAAKEYAEGDPHAANDRELLRIALLAAWRVR